MCHSIQMVSRLKQASRSQLAVPTRESRLTIFRALLENTYCRGPARPRILYSVFNLQ